MNQLDQKRRAMRSISESSLQKPNARYDNKFKDSKEMHGSYLQTSSFISMPKGRFFEQVKVSSNATKSNSLHTKSVSDILRMNAKAKEEEEQSIQKSRSIIQKSIERVDSSANIAQTDRYGHSRGNQQSAYLSTRVPTSQFGGLNTATGDKRLMQYYNFEDFLERTKHSQIPAHHHPQLVLPQNYSQQTLQQNSAPLLLQNSQQQQQPYQNRGVVHVQKAYMTNLHNQKQPRAHNKLTLQQKKAQQSAEEYYKYLAKKNNSSMKQIGSDSGNITVKQPSLDQIFENVYQEQQQEEQQQAFLLTQYQNKSFSNKMNTDPNNRIKQPKQTEVRVLKLNEDRLSDFDSPISEQYSMEMQSSIQDKPKNMKFHKIEQQQSENNNDPLYEEEFMKEIRVSVQRDQNSIKIEAELGRVYNPKVVNLKVQMLTECPSEFLQLDFKEIYELPEQPSIKYIKCFNNASNREEIVEIFECQNINSHLYYFKNIVLRHLLSNKGIAPSPTIPTFALISSNKTVILSVFPVLIPLESIIQFRYFSRKPFPEKQLLTLMKNMIFQIKYIYENYRLSIGQIATDAIFLDCSDFQLKFFNLSSASIHILPNQLWNSSSLMKDCQELGQCFFMLKNLMTQQRMDEKNDSMQIESIYEMEESRDQYSSEIILELLKIQKVSFEAESQYQDYDPFRKINKIFQNDMKEYQFEIVDLDFKKLDIFMNARILKDNETLSIYYEKTHQPIRALALKNTKTCSEKKQELQLLLENWKLYLQSKQYEKCEEFGDTYITNYFEEQEEEEMDDHQKLSMAEIFSKQGGVKIILGKFEDGRRYLLSSLNLHNKMNSRYCSSSAMTMVELAKLDLVYCDTLNCETSANYLIELYFVQLFQKEGSTYWSSSLSTQIYEMLALLASKLNIFEVQPFLYSAIISKLKVELEKKMRLIKSNQLVEYYIKSAESHQEYSNFNQAALALQACVPYAENDTYLEKIAQKQSSVLQEARELASTEKVSNEDFQNIENFRSSLSNCLFQNPPDHKQYAEIFETYYSFIMQQNIQTDEEFIQDLMSGSAIIGGGSIKQPQKAQKYLLKAMEKIFQSVKYSEEQVKLLQLEIYEKIGLYCFEQDQDLLALMWFLLCVMIRIEELQSFINYEENYFRNLNQLSKCCQRLKYNYAYLHIQKVIVASMKSEEDQLRVLTNITKMNIEMANLQDGYEFNQLAKQLAEKLKDFQTLENLKTYRLSLISKMPDSDEAKEYMNSLKETIQSLLNAGDDDSEQEAIFLYQQYFKILESQKTPDLTIQTVENYNEYADLIWRKGDKKKAMIQFKKGLKVQIKLFGLNDANTMKNMNNVGVLYFELEMHEQALILFEDILKALRRSKSYNSQYFSALEYEANIYKQQKNIEQSLVSLHEYHDVISKFPPKQNQYALKFYEVCFEIGKLYSEQRKFHEAEPYFREALQLKTKQLSNDINIIIQKYLYEYSQCLFQVGNQQEAHCVFKEQVDTWRRARTIKGNQMQMYLDDYHQLFLNYSDISFMFDILSDMKHNFEQKNVKTNIHTNDFYKSICVKLVEIEIHHKQKS